MKPQPATGMTLLEAIIALAILMVAAGATFEAMTSTRHMSSLGAAKDEIERSASQALHEIGADLAASGWEFIDPTATTSYTVATQDRARRYYPFVQIQPTPAGGLDEGMGDRFPWTRLATAMRTLPALPEQVPGEAADATSAISSATGWATSFSARSQQLIFLRSLIGTWVQTEDPGDARNGSVFQGMAADRYAAMRPSEHIAAPLDFTFSSTGQPTTLADWRTAGNHAKLRVLYAAGFTKDVSTGDWTERYADKPYGVVLDAGRFDTADEEVPLKPQWETMSLPTYQGTAADTLREFMYAVVPSPIEGSYGRLVRAFRRNVTDGAPPVGSDLGQRITDVAEDNGVKVAMIVDRILAEDVVRLVCDTVRTVDAGQATVRTLSLNQVRIRLFLVRRQVTEPSRVVFRTMEATFAMRARGSANDMTRTQTILGTAPIGLAH